MQSPSKRSIAGSNLFVLSHYYDHDICFNLPSIFLSLASIDVRVDLSRLAEIQQFEYRKTNEIGSSETYITKNNKVLNYYQAEADMLLEYFYYYKDEHLKFLSTDFRISTSWGTKTNPGGLFSTITTKTLHLVVYFTLMMYLVEK